LVTMTRAVAGKTLYEVFDALTLWSTITGTWALNSGYYKGVATVATRQSAKYTGSNPPADFVLEYKTKVSVASALANLIIRAADALADSNDRIWCRLDSRSSPTGGIHGFQDVAGAETQVGTYSFSPVLNTDYYIKLVVSGTSITCYADTDGYGHTSRWVATVTKITAGYLLVQVEYSINADAWFDNIKIYKNQTITISGLAENNYVDLINSSGAVVCSATAGVDGIATLDFSAGTTRPPYHEVLVWDTSARGTLLYQPTVGVSWFNDMWGGDEYTYGAGTDPPGCTDITPDSGTKSHTLVSFTNQVLPLDSDCVHVEVGTGVRFSGIQILRGLLWNTPYKIEGVTKTSAGVVLGGCTVILINKDSGQMEQETTSDASTGAYKFFVRDPVTTYFVVAFKAGSPNVFGRTDKTIQGVAV